MRPAILPDEALPDESSSSPAGLWHAIDDLLDRASPEGILLHGLGPLGARRLRRLGRLVPAALEREERSAVLFAAIATPLVQRVRQSCAGPLILIKGPEIATLYPPGGRAFSDIDLLSPQPENVQKSLLDTGFVIDERGIDAPQHLWPLFLETFPLEVEVHRNVKWPALLEPPDLAEIIEASVPSSLAVDGVFAPCAAHHALILAAHSWEHRPLRVVRDLLDIALVSAGIDERELERTADAWELGPIWRTTRGAIEGVFYGGRKTVPLRSWARHIDEIRDRTVFESHLERWMSPFWGLRTRAALANTTHVLRQEVGRSRGESWGSKLRRSVLAAWHAGIPLRRHQEATIEKKQVPPARDGR